MGEMEGQVSAQGLARHPLLRLGCMLLSAPDYMLNTKGLSLGFWSEITTRNKALLQNWISEQFEFLLQFSAVTFAYVVFRILRALGVESDFLDLLDKLDKGAIVIVFGLFLLGVVRRAAVNTFASEKQWQCSPIGFATMCL
jgi:hypothetical protein